jgi:hypothetical protein
MLLINGWSYGSVTVKVNGSSIIGLGSYASLGDVSQGYFLNKTVNIIYVKFTASSPTEISASYGAVPELIIEPIAVGVTVAAASAASVALYRYLRRRR